MASKHVRNSLDDLIVSGINNAPAIGSIEWIGVGMGATLCFQKNGKTLGLDRMWTKYILSVGMVLLLMQSVLAADDEGHYNGSSGHAALPQDPAVPSNLSARATPMKDWLLGALAVPTDPSGATAESTREQPGFSSVLTLLASSDQEPQTPVQPSVLANASSAINNDNQTAGTTDPLSLAPVANSTSNTSSEEAVSSLPANPDLPTVPVSSLATLGEGDSTLPDNVTSPFSTHTWNTTKPARADNNTTIPSTTAAHTNPTPDTVTNDSLQLTTVTTTTVTPLTVTTTTVTPQTTTALTTEAVTTIPRTTTTPQEVTTFQETTLMTTTTDPPTTAMTTTSAPTTTNAPTTSTTTTAPTTTLTVPTTTTETTPGPTTTESPPISAEEERQPCNITEKTWVKTVLSMQLRRNRLDIIVRQNLSKGLTHALQRAFNDTNVYVQIERDLCSPHNVTLGYYVASGKMVYIASVVVETVKAYGFDKVLADIRQHSPLVMAVLLPVAPWAPSLSVHLQLKTVLRFVGPADSINSCSFVQMMEQRLENAFEEAQDKVMESYSGLSVEIQSTSQAIGSPAVSLVYVVKNQAAILNGTVSSGLLNQLTAELVGYFLFFPPLVIAEPLEYHNLNTSTATKHYWVITVIQDVDSSSLERNYQSFASLMEQRLAELFLVAGRQGSQGSRFRRATTVGDYTVQMVGIRRLPGPKNPAEMTYYAQLNGAPITGTTAAKTLSTLDSQTMALTLGYFIQRQADPVVKVPPANLWIMAVLTPVALVMVVVVMVTAILCKRNRVIFKTGAFRSFKTRSKTSYRREGSYHHQPVQGFDYAKKHMGHQQGEETISVTKETLVLGLPVRDAPLSLDRKVHQDGTASKRPPSADIIHKGLPSEDGSVTSNESRKLNTGKSSMVRRPAVQNSAKEDLLHKRNADPYEDHTGSLRLITIKPMAAQPTYSYPSSSSHSQDSVVLNGEANVGLKQKSDIEHYRNKQRQKANRKGYCDFPVTDNGIHPFNPRERHSRHENAKEPMTAEEKRASYAGCHIRRHPPSREPAYWSRQSLAASSPGPVETEMDLLVLRERSRRGIRNSGYDVEPLEETNVDRLMSSLGYGGSHQVKGLSDSSTLSSQPSIGEVRQQMQLLLGNAFGLAPDEALPSNHHHPHIHPHLHSSYNPSHTSPYSEGVTSAPGTMNHPCGGGRQHGSAYGPEIHQCSLPKPGFRFTQLPDMCVGPPPTLIPSRPGPPPGTSMRRSTPDISLKPRISEASEIQNQHNGATYLPINRAPFPAVTVDQSMTSYSGNPMTAVYAISANHPGYSDYFVMSPPSSYGSPSWMSYPPEPEDIPHQWNDTNPCHLETIC
ncbi:UPF0606 protein KIAA1549L isoform X1 [Oncorhynchus clarkii lewisi]|uniref:UPF0606 protein KIAA1549L isoform X1 n=1 Tax=Oncorhynchus clarkii lewisi TaxID=490388 RepID=UPI0039B97A5A